MIRILQVVSGIMNGGVENQILYLCKNMNKEFFSIDILTMGMESCAMEEEFIEQGVNIFHIPRKRDSLFENLSGMKQVIINGKYDIIHCHQDEISFFPLYFAYKYGIMSRFAHAHLAYVPQSKIRKIVNLYLSHGVKKYATHCFGCTEAAVISLYGRRFLSQKKAKVIKCGVDLRDYYYDISLRSSIRNKMSLNGKFVVCDVGRIAYQKNPHFAIEIFRKLLKYKENAVLLFIGQGELKQEINELVIHYGLEKKVIFYGCSNNVAELLQASDAFLLPARYEGFGIVLIESQAAGLPTFTSRENIPNDVNVSVLIHRISQKSSADEWAKQINKYSDIERVNMQEQLKNSPYLVNKFVDSMQSEYFNAYLENQKESMIRKRRK